jgi:hypothetical protein
MSDDSSEVGQVMGYDYELRIRGRLTSTLKHEFEELALAASVQPVETVLAGPVQDQAALHGLIRRIEALGLELVEVRRLPAGWGSAADADDARAESG